VLLPSLSRAFADDRPELQPPARLGAADDVLDGVAAMLACLLADGMIAGCLQEVVRGTSFRQPHALIGYAVA